MGMMDNTESIEVKIARIEERVSSARRNHAIQFQNLDGKLDLILSSIQASSTDLEGDIKYFKEEACKRIEATDTKLSSDIEELEDTIAKYKKSMRPIEKLTYNKNMGLYMLTFAIAVGFWEQMMLILDIFKKKYLGL